MSAAPWELDQFVDKLCEAIEFSATQGDPDGPLADEGVVVATYAEAGISRTVEGLVVSTNRGTFHLTIAAAR